MTAVRERPSGHLHAFEIAGRAYLVNATTGRSFALGADGIDATSLHRFGHLDAVDLEALDFGPPPTRIGSVLLNVTHHCNLACAYCIMAMPDLEHAYRDERQSLTDATGKALLDLLADIGDPNGVSITFFGGEPLLRFDLIKDLVEYAAATHPDRFTWQLITNGCLMRPDMHAFFEAHRFSFLWSLDGEPEVHDRLRRFKTGDDSVFARSFAALEALRSDCPDCPIGVNITYFRQTLELPEAVRFFRRHGIESIRMDRGLVPRGSPHAVGVDDAGTVNRQLTDVAAGYLAMLLRGETFTLNPFVNYMRVIAKGLPRSRACNSGLDYITVAATGDVYSCYKLLGLPDCRLGDVRAGFDGESSRRLWDRLHVGSRKGCRWCWARFICAGGCAADNRHLNGAYDEPARENCAIFVTAIELSIHLFHTLLEAAPRTLKALLGDEHLADDDRPSASDALRRSPGGLRVENTRTGGVYRFNRPAARLLSMCDGDHSLADMAASISGRHGLPPALARFEVREQVFRMAKAGLVSVPSQPAGAGVSSGPARERGLS